MAMRRRVLAVTLCAAALLVSSCALRAPAADEVGNSLSDYIAKIRHLSAPPLVARTGVESMEARDPALAAALAALAAAPTPAAYRVAGERYRALGVLDAAYRYFTVAVAGDPGDAAAFDGLARVWRDWGLPHLGLADAYRAVFHAPRSAAAHNTLGTVLQALGHDREAQRGYEASFLLDARAAYALSNLCYLQFREGAIDGAIATCERAVSLDPGLGAARNNLALAQAARGQSDVAEVTLMGAPTAAEGFFNLGILRMAAREYGRAATAFDAASRAEPRMHLARARAEQARDLGYATTPKAVRSAQ